jgi:methylglyoxal synthase
MANQNLYVKNKKKIALIAHDERKQDLLEWVKFNKGTLSKHELFATETTGLIIERDVGLKVTNFLSGPLGGDQQIGAKITEGDIDFLIFFWDPLESHPHDTDVKALLRISVVWNIPVACNRATADYMVSSPLMLEDYERHIIDYSKRYERQF